MTVALVDEDGDILERYEYDAYGKPTMWLGDYDMLNQEISPYGNPYYFTGRRVDEINNGEWLIQYNRNRFLDYYTGRWMNEDPIGYQDGVNLYAYVNSNPMNRVDSMGLFTIESINMPLWTDELYNSNQSGEPDQKYTTNSSLAHAWWSIAVFLTPKEKEVLARFGSGTMIYSKLAAWRIKDCDTSETLFFGVESVSFQNTFQMVGLEMLATTRSSEGVRINTENEEGHTKQTRNGLYFSLINKNFGNPVNNREALMRSGTSGYIVAMAFMSLYGGSEEFEGFSDISNPPGGPNKVVSDTEYQHDMLMFPGAAPMLEEDNRIATGRISVAMQWGCDPWANPDSYPTFHKDSDCYSEVEDDYRNTRQGEDIRWNHEYGIGRNILFYPFRVPE